MTRSTFDVSAQVLADMMLPGKTVMVVRAEPADDYSDRLRFTIEHTEHTIPEGPVTISYRQVGPIIGQSGVTPQYTTILGDIKAVMPPAPLHPNIQRQIDAAFPVPGDEHRGTGRSFKQLTELIESSARGLACMFVTPGPVDQWVNIAIDAARVKGVGANYWPTQRVLTIIPNKLQGGAVGTIRFVTQDEYQQSMAPGGRFAGINIQHCMADHAMIETKPATVPSTAPSPQPNSPTPAPAPSTTQAPPAPETKEGGGIGQAINAERANLDSYKP